MNMVQTITIEELQNIQKRLCMLPSHMVTKKCVYDKILLLDSGGIDKTVCCNFLEDKLGYNVFACDAGELKDPNISDNDFSWGVAQYVDEVMDFAEENPKWIIDYDRYKGDDGLVHFLVRNADFILYHDFSLKKTPEQRRESQVMKENLMAAKGDFRTVKSFADITRFKKDFSKGVQKNPYELSLVDDSYYEKFELQRPY